MANCAGALIRIFICVLGLGAATAGRAETPGETLADRFPALRAMVLARGSCVVIEYYRKGFGPETRSPVYSVAKSVLSILVGVAIDRGLMRLDEKLGEGLPETLGPGVDPRLREVTVRDLLTMTAGFAAPPQSGETESEAIRKRTWRALLEVGFRYPPGSRFEYDGRGPDLLSVALSRAARRYGARFARDSLFAPLGIRNFVWKADEEGHLTGDTDLFLIARDMAKIGLLYLQQGRWGAAQVVSSRYVAESTTPHNRGGPPFEAYYGYLWWVEGAGAHRGAFSAAGQQGQLIEVLPDRHLVVAVAADAALPPGFVDDVVLPAEAALPASAPCLASLGPELAR